MVELETNNRNTDPEEARLLAAVRIGAASDREVLHGLNERCKLFEATDEEIEMLERTTDLRGSEVQRHLQKQHTAHTATPEALFEKLSKLEEAHPGKDFFILAPRRCQDFRLAIGCKMMVTKNIAAADKVVNGPIGCLSEIGDDFIIIDLPKTGKYRVNRTKYQNEEGTVFWEQFPIMAAEASTYHKSQGLSFDGVIVVTDGIFRKTVYTLPYPESGT
ncbi:hypothetical protein GCK72_012177 [Caenorhabditis remanei]|uniref:ATP-dependent DNA helicase n=1 Tax=Caenorhabditis remanei TaxID=31234 RepID=A0A6A5GK86_CAERE|nr:hypothetical protein GCK72_012177 [Caenorhabditis remanei]KAF1755727.1 hypothetical protein GCK72_012177 [Caenorhabditis remanei]